MTVLEYLVKKYPNKDWDWSFISSNENISLEFIKNNPELPWDWWGGIFSGISSNPNLTIEFIKENQDKKWNWKAITENKGITMEDIESNPDLPWDFLLHIYFNPNLTLKFIKDNSHKLYTLVLNWQRISSNEGITMDDIKNNPNLNWCYYDGVSRNPNLTIKFVNDNLDKKWDMESIESTLKLKHVVSIKIVKEKLNNNLDWYKISKNKGISIEDIETNPELPWNWDGISQNPNITLEFIENNLDKINFGWLSYNKFNSNLNN